MIWAIAAATFTQSSVFDILRTATSIPCSLSKATGLSMRCQCSSIKSMKGLWPSQARTTGQRKNFRNNSRWLPWQIETASDTLPLKYLSITRFCVASKLRRVPLNTCPILRSIKTSSSAFQSPVDGAFPLSRIFIATFGSVKRIWATSWSRKPRTAFMRVGDASSGIDGMFTSTGSPRRL